MNTAQLYMKGKLHLQHHLQWNVIDPAQYVAWKYLDSRYCNLTKMSVRHAPMNWIHTDIRKN